MGWNPPVRAKRATDGELPLLEEIKIPRCLKYTSTKESSITLHTCSNASEKAYAAAVYSRHEYDDGSITTRLIASKTRLAPSKAARIPRLELMGARIDWPIKFALHFKSRLAMSHTG